MKPRKKLIEVSLPLDAINMASAREKSIRQGHPSLMHIGGQGGLSLLHGRCFLLKFWMTLPRARTCFLLMMLKMTSESDFSVL